MGAQIEIILVFGVNMDFSLFDVVRVTEYAFVNFPVIVVL